MRIPTMARGGALRLPTSFWPKSSKIPAIREILLPEMTMTCEVPVRLNFSYKPGGIAYKIQYQFVLYLNAIPAFVGVSTRA
jgi:hypothetical protein